MKCIAYLTITLALIHCASGVLVAFGESFSVKGNTQTSATISLIATLDILLDGDANVTVSESLFTQATLPSGIQTVSFTGSASVAITLTITPSSVSIINATFSTPPLSATVYALITGSGAVGGVLRYDANAQVYNQIDVPPVGASQKIVVPLPASGTYVFVLIWANATIPVWYGVHKVLPPHVEKKFQLPGGFYLDVTVDTSNNVVIYVNETNPTPKQFANYVLVSYYYPIALATETAVNSTLRYAYNRTELVAKNIVEPSLRWAFYNVTSGAWELVTGSYVDVSATVVIQPTSHFSTWAVYGQTSNGSSSGTEASTTGSDASKVVSSLMCVILAIALLL